MRKLLLTVGMAMMAALVFVTPAMAKMTITSQEMPAATTVEEPFEVRFELEDHEGVADKATDMAVTATNSETGAEETFAATLVGDTWVAVVNLPTAGNWDLFVTSEIIGFRQPLGTTETTLGSATLATSKQVTSGLAALRADLEKEIANVKAEQDILTKQMKATGGGSTAEFDKRLSNLALEVDQLNKEIAAMEVAGSGEATGSSTPWWVAALVASGATAIILGGAAILAARRGVLDTLVLAPRPGSS